MRIKELGYDEWKRDFEVLAQQHFLEVLAPRGYSYSLDEELFANLAENDALFIIGAYDDSHLPIGYSMSIISPDIHDTGATVAYTNAFFLHPDHRAGLAGVKLLRVTEAALVAKAPNARWRLGIPIDGDRDMGRVLERVGLTAFERVYTKTLTPGGGVHD